MSTVMIQLCLPLGEASLADAAKALDLAPEDLDREFGLIATDPTRNLYAVRVSAEVAARAENALRRRNSNGAEGVFSDPKVAPFWPPQ